MDHRLAILCLTILAVYANVVWMEFRLEKVERMIDCAVAQGVNCR